MMITAAGFARRDLTELPRWSASLLVVLLLHGAAGLFLLSRQVPLDEGGPPSAAVMIDLAPLPAPSPPQRAPPEPVVERQLQPQAEPTPPPPPPPPPEIELPKVEPIPAPKPAVVLPPKPPRPKLRPVEHPPEVAPERPPPAPAQAVTAPPAPATAPPAVNSAASRMSWQAQLAGWLERYKRYPRLAQEQRQEGTVYLRFAIDRQGRVLSSQIEKGSGYALLDEEVFALIQRAQPLPAPPQEIPGTRIELTVPIQFTLRSGAR